MFVLKSTYEELKVKLSNALNRVDYWRNCFNEMQDNYNNKKIELRKSESEFEVLSQALIDIGVTNFNQIKGLLSFSPDEIRTLISLCHPDRHGGKESAKTMTQKLLAIRDKRQ